MCSQTSVLVGGSYFALRSCCLYPGEDLVSTRETGDHKASKIFLELELKTDFQRVVEDRIPFTQLM